MNYRIKIPTVDSTFKSLLLPKKYDKIFKNMIPTLTVGDTFIDHYGFEYLIIKKQHDFIHNLVNFTVKKIK